MTKGDTLNLSCSVDSHPASSDPVWIFIGTSDKLKNHNKGGNLIITNVNMQHAGEYVCVVAYMNTLLNTFININVISK